REENAELRQWMNEALELRRTIAGYEKLQTYAPPPDALPIDAFVIGESNDAFARSMIVNVGRRDGVERDFAVVDDSGLVGHIVEAGASSARVLLLTDVQSRVPVYLEGAEIDGILVGRSRARPAISFTSNSEPATIAPGQRILTSGAGGSLPRGLPVGEVRAIRGAEAIVDLYANYARTRIVRVMNYEFTPAVDASVDILAPIGDDPAASDDDATSGDDAAGNDATSRNDAAAGANAGDSASDSADGGAPPTGDQG
ncbi:MAG: rod shape-determining protein MreC, partial [Pseudomonadota bacterium]